MMRYHDKWLLEMASRKISKMHMSDTASWLRQRQIQIRRTAKCCSVTSGDNFNHTHIYSDHERIPRIRWLRQTQGFCFVDLCYFDYFGHLWYLLKNVLWPFPAPKTARTCFLHQGLPLAQQRRTPLRHLDENICNLSVWVISRWTSTAVPIPEALVIFTIIVYYCIILIIHIYIYIYYNYIINALNIILLINYLLFSHLLVWFQTKVNLCGFLDKNGCPPGGRRLTQTWAHEDNESCSMHPFLVASPKKCGLKW